MPKANGQNLMVITESSEKYIVFAKHCKDATIYNCVLNFGRGRVGGKKREFSPRVRKHSFYHIKPTQ